MVVYLISGVVRRTVPMWWLGLDQVVAGNEEIEFWRDGAVESIPAATATQKRRAYFHLAKALQKDGQSFGACQAVTTGLRLATIRKDPTLGQLEALAKELGCK